MAYNRTAVVAPSNGSNVDRDGKAVWSNPNNVTVNDSSSASCAVGKGTYSDYLYVAFPLSVPDGAYVEGLAISVSRYGSTSDIKDSVLDVQFSSGTLTSSNLASGSSWPTSMGNAAYGGATNLIGFTAAQLTTAVLNGGAVVRLSVNNSASNNSRTAYVNFIQLTVYYRLVCGLLCSETIKCSEVGSSPDSIFSVGVLDSVRGSEAIQSGMAYFDTVSDSGKIYDRDMICIDVATADSIKAGELVPTELTLGGVLKKISINGVLPSSGMVQIPILLTQSDTEAVAILTNAKNT